MFLSPQTVRAVRAPKKRSIHSAEDEAQLAETERLVIYCYSGMEHEELAQTYVSAFLKAPSLTLRSGIELAIMARRESKSLEATDIILAGEVATLAETQEKVHCRSDDLIASP